jgi:hypothetical protein
MQPIVNGLEQQYGARLAFESRDATAAANQASMRAYGLRGHPSYAIVDQSGQVRWSASGSLPEAALRQKVEQILAP